MEAMGYQPRARAPREFGKRSEKARPKTKAEKRRASGIYSVGEEHIPSRDEVFNRTLNGLHHLGTQRFAVPPFHEHFDRWLLSLRTILSEFESSESVTLDDQFREQYGQVLSDIELDLKQRRLREASREEAIRKVSQSIIEARSALAQAEREYAAKTKEFAGQRERAVKPVAGRAGKIREELKRIIGMRAGFLRGISKRAKAQKEAEATERLDSAKRELEKIERTFATEQQKLRQEHSKRKRLLLEQIADHQKEIESLDTSSRIDDSVDARRAACDALIDAVKALAQRNEQTSETTSISQ